MSRRRYPRLILGLTTLALTFSGCASVKVLPQSKAPPAAQAVRPQRLIVGDFDFGDDAFAGKRPNPPREAKTREELRTTLRTDLQRALQPLKLPVATTASAPVRAAQPAWLITGNFSRVDPGNLFTRVAIGFGFGKSKVETAVKVQDLSAPKAPPVATFGTTSFSGGDPGLILSIGTTPVAAVDAGLTLVSTIGSGPKDDTARTARMIAAYVSELLAERGWLDPKLVRRAKK